MRRSAIEPYVQGRFARLAMAFPIRACTFGSLKGSSRSRGASSPANMTRPDGGAFRSPHFCSAARKTRRGQDSRGSAPAFLVSSETTARERLLFIGLAQATPDTRGRAISCAASRVLTAPLRVWSQVHCLVQRKMTQRVPRRVKSRPSTTKTCAADQRGETARRLRACSASHWV